MILDPACGSKMFWFDKDNTDVVFGDRRVENYVLCDGRKLAIRPAVQMDFAAMPFKDGQFDMVVFDPPHLKNVGANSWMAKKYGSLEKGWQDYIRQGFSECFRVLQYGGTLIFKWNEVQIPVSEILKLTPYKPLFGHKSGKNSLTHWICFNKRKFYVNRKLQPRRK
jgi:hypothetical protein